MNMIYPLDLIHSSILTTLLYTFYKLSLFKENIMKAKKNIYLT